MKISDFSDPEELTTENLSYLTPNSSGAYLLGKMNNGQFEVEYWGSAYFDNGVKSRLENHIGNYDMFKVKTTLSDDTAWKYECLAFHTYGTEETDNERHPKRPNNQTKETLKCPIENCLL